MKYIYESRKRLPFITEEITREEALLYLSEDELNDIANNETAKRMKAAVLIELEDGVHVGIQF